MCSFCDSKLKVTQRGRGCILQIPPAQGSGIFHKIFIKNPLSQASFFFFAIVKFGEGYQKEEGGGFKTVEEYTPWYHYFLNLYAVISVVHTRFLLGIMLLLISPSPILHFSYRVANPPPMYYYNFTYIHFTD